MSQVKSQGDPSFAKVNNLEIQLLVLFKKYSIFQKKRKFFLKTLSNI